MKKLSFTLLLIIFLSGFSSKNVEHNVNRKGKLQYLTFEDCKGQFSKEIRKQGRGISRIIKAYKIFPCFPLQTIEFLQKKHSEDEWVFSELAKQRVLSPLSQEDELKLISKLLPFVKQKSEIEKYLLRNLYLKNKLKISSVEDSQKLQAKFPSHNPHKIKHPDLSVVKDLKRRGQNHRALEVLKSLRRKEPFDLKVQKQLVSTQKNIARNADYLDYSQKYVNAVYKKYRRNKRNKRNRKLYLNEALRNVRRIWTYRSTSQALKKLDLLIRYHCKTARECSEHYWIKGRIYEELGNSKLAHRWLQKAVRATPTRDREYQNRVWNLVWLESKILGPRTALFSANKFLIPIKNKDVHSRLFYWMSRWSETAEEKKKYVDLIKTHQPMSFYLWSKFALGKGLTLKTQSLKKFKRGLKSDHEKNLLTIMEAQELSLAQSYIKHISKTLNFKKTLSWKRLKALNGMYLDLQLDLNAGLIKAEDNLQFFFSRGFYGDVISASSEFSIDKELIWSITRQESNFNPYARSWADAFGLMQILPKRAVNYLNDTQKNPKALPVQAINPFKLYDPKFNISIGAWLLRKNLSNFKGRLPLAIAAYNASVNKVEEWERRFYNGDWMQFMEEITYRETRKYVKLVLRNREIYSALEKSSKLNLNQ